MFSMKCYKTSYCGDGDEVDITKLNLMKRTVILELNDAAKADNGHEIGETQVSYFATKREAEAHSERLLITKGHAWLIDEEPSE